MDILHEIPQDELAEINEISKRCHELHASAPVIATVELEVVDLKTGEVLSKYGDLSRSWTRNYYNVIACQTFCTGGNILGATFADGFLEMKNTDGTLRGSGSRGQVFGGKEYGSRESCEESSASGWRGILANATVGIVIGRGTNAESFGDYVLQTPILEGVGTNQMNYWAMAVPAVSWDGGLKKFKSIGTRSIVNASVGSIGVNEAGIYGWGGPDDSASVICFVRDKLGAQVDCPAASKVTVTYTLYSEAYP